MTTLSNREKNIEYDARQNAKARPAPVTYNFEDLDRVVREWVTGSRVARNEIYSPYLGAL
jgi:hypothetical protein